MGKRMNRVSGIMEHLCLEHQAPRKENEEHKIPLPYSVADYPALALDCTLEVV